MCLFVCLFEVSDGYLQQERQKKTDRRNLKILNKKKDTNIENSIQTKKLFYGGWHDGSYVVACFVI